MVAKKKIFFGIQTIICFLGLAFQIKEVSETYFQFTTDTKVSISIHIIIDPPSLSVCFWLGDIVQNDTIAKLLKVKQNKLTLNMVDNLTIANFFDLSPRVDKVIKNKFTKNSSK